MHEQPQQQDQPDYLTMSVHSVDNSFVCMNAWICAKRGARDGSSFFHKHIQFALNAYQANFKIYKPGNLICNIRYMYTVRILVLILYSM